MTDPFPRAAPRPAPAGPRQSLARRYGWPLGIAIVLVASAASNVAVMLVARADPAFAVEPDYYRKAVTWDSTMAQERLNATLGWQAVATLALARPGIPGTISVALRDGEGTPLQGLQVSVEAMHNARASQRYQVALGAGEDGTYAAPIDAHRAGAWEVRVTAIRGAVRFTQILRLDAQQASSSLPPPATDAPAIGGLHAPPRSRLS